MELEEAIKILKSYENKLVYEISEKDKEAVAVVLTHLTKQDKMIEFMAEALEYNGEGEKEEIIQVVREHVENKAEESE